MWTNPASTPGLVVALAWPWAGSLPHSLASVRLRPKRRSEDANGKSSAASGSCNSAHREAAPAAAAITVGPTPATALPVASRSARPALTPPSVAKMAGRIALTAVAPSSSCVWPYREHRARRDTIDGGFFSLTTTICTGGEHAHFKVRSLDPPAAWPGDGWAGIGALRPHRHGLDRRQKEAQTHEAQETLQEARRVMYRRRTPVLPWPDLRRRPCPGHVLLQTGRCFVQQESGLLQPAMPRRTVRAELAVASKPCHPEHSISGGHMAIRHVITIQAAPGSSPQIERFETDE